MDLDHNRKYQKLNVRSRLESKYRVLQNGCWLWLDKPNDSGYGRFYFNRKIYRAHRFVYELHKGKIPDGLVLDHVCRNRLCVNPDHLEPVTIGENVLRGETLAAINILKTHCPQGHELSGDNLLSEKHRKCKRCHRERERRRRNGLKQN